ncbi:MAG: AAA family ATPase [Candidatus Pacearchaeota archaeon]|jgi:exonuclease SbcC
MLLKKITLNNIRSYENETVDFPEGSTLLSGDIGSGKTSILLGIEFALFGLQPGQRGSALLKNSTDAGGVIIEFNIDDKEIIIERTLKKGKTISQDYCAITINGEKHELSVTELKTRVLELLNYPTEFSKKQNILYKFTVYTPQEEMKQIILQDNETRINTLRHVFGIDKYKRILENTYLVAAKIREEKRLKEGMTINLEEDKINLTAKENELESLKINLSSVEREVFSKKEKRIKTQNEKEELSKKIEEKNKILQEIEKTDIVIKTKKNSISENEKLVVNINNQISELSEINFDEEKIGELEKEINLLKKKKEKSEEEKIVINSEIASVNLKNSENEKLKQKISNLESCPTCLQKVDAVYRANVLNNLHNDLSKNKNKSEELEFAKNEITEKIKEVNFSIFEKEKEIGELKILKIRLEGIREKSERLEEIKKSNISLNKDIELLAGHVETMKISFSELSKFDKLFDEKKSELENDLRLEKIAEIKLAELKKEISVFSNQIEELRNRIIKSEEVKKNLEKLTKVENWLTKKFVSLISFIERNVMIKLKHEFSKLLNEWFSMLVSDSFEVRLSDDFTPIIEQQDYEIDYQYLSGGERTAIALAYRLSLNQVINSLMSKIKTRDLVILDEPTDGFSEQQLDKMRDVLQELNIKQLIIVSHEQKIEGFVENVLKFKKENGASKLLA